MERFMELYIAGHITADDFVTGVNVFVENESRVSIPRRIADVYGRFSLEAMLEEEVRLQFRFEKCHPYLLMERLGISYTFRAKACHVLVQDNMQSVYTLRNYGRNSNCSLTSLFPVKVSLLSLSVGITMTGSNFKVETGTMKKCQETGHKDYLEVSGGDDFAVPKVLTGANLCGLDSYPGKISETILCGVSSVTLYSSGDYDNSATVAVRQATEEDILSPAALICT